jgi:uncharacterized protein YbbK (DUF523 family)
MPPPTPSKSAASLASVSTDFGTASPAPLYLVSACLCGVACRWDGRAAPVERLAALYRRGLALAVCPEVDGGLPTPRPPCELRNGRAVTRDGEDLTARFQAGAAHALGLAQQHDIHLAVLKERSPSCGSTEVYDGTFSGVRVPGAGITAALLAAHGIRVVNEREFEKMPAMELRPGSLWEK